MKQLFKNRKTIATLSTTLLVFVVGAYFLLEHFRKVAFMRGHDEPAVALSAMYAEQEKKQPSEIDYLYSRITEKDFVQFASSTIDVKCPFYEPSGANYRVCLYDWAEKLSKNKTKNEIDAVDRYCEQFTAKYEDVQELPGHELFAKCRIYRYSLKSSI